MSVSLAKAYLEKAQKRLKILPVLLAEEAYSDVVREAQEIVELALKGILRYVGIDPPKWHDVGSILLDNRERLPEDVALQADQMAKISAWLRKEREFSFYGDIDFVPTEQYVSEDAERAIQDAHFVVQVAERIIR
ncbi:MAG: HEPN domain-containing protein [Anaerolineales bacterium]|nr:HEPN domain-containing protein [Anaerolineales bacterium]MCS7248447.1 HEPN domain-containing protein [Anaerolineales bacterium]MDW8162260.1 HEPN domain-containing protein [Anaerolineales bacterium]MDW8447807.1 HEPN domain-containing protein [Anaerolineales bacterium]